MSHFERDDITDIWSRCYGSRATKWVHSIFFTTIENQKGGAVSKEEFKPNVNLKALHIPGNGD